MKLTSDNIIYIEVPDLVKCGVSIFTIKDGLKRHRQGLVSCWQHIKEGNKIFIHYDSLKENYKNLIKQTLCGGNDIREYIIKSRIKNFLKRDENALKFYKNYLLPNGEHLPETYIKRYAQACAYLNLITEFNLNKQLVKKLNINKSQIYTLISNIVKADSLELPANPSRIYDKWKNYVSINGQQTTVNYETLISKRFCNTNTLKRTPEADDFLISNYALPIKMDIPALTLKYNTWARQQNQLEPQNPKLRTLTEQAISAFLHKPEVESIWWMGRHGLHSWRKRFEHTMKLFMPTYRDAMWVSDGTKLNLYHKDDNAIKMASKLKINKIIDAYSECILGYDISTTEDHVSNYIMFKNAVKFSGHKPIQILHDGQGGYMKANMQEFLEKLSSVHFKAKPYRAQSKSIESVIYRFQHQIMSKYWFFTGQNIQSKKEDSKANMDFILSHKEFLPTIEEAKILMADMINEWNNSKHPKYNKTRLELYKESINPNARPVDYIDMVELFWLTNQKPVTYRKSGLTIILGGKEFEFEVYENDGVTPKESFINKYINTRIIVKYDPDDLNHIRLYSQYGEDIRFIDLAYLKKEYARFTGDLTPGMRADIDKNLKLDKDTINNTKRKLKEVQERSGIDPETLISVGFRTEYKNEVNNAEAELVLADNYHKKHQHITKTDDDMWLQLYERNKNKINE